MRRCRATGRSISAEGRVVATLEQSCVVTSEPVAAHVDEPFALLFMPDPESSRPDEEIELGEQDCDVVFYDGATIDLGSAIADTLALSIDPYPRSASAEAALKEAGVLSEEQASPFAALATKEGRRRCLERNVVVKVGVKRRRLRTRLRAESPSALHRRNRQNLR